MSNNSKAFVEIPADTFRTTEDPTPPPFEENKKLQCKITRIAEEIAVRFDADGIDDIRIPKKVSIWWVILNLASVAKLVSDIINVIKHECNDNQVSEATLNTNS